jgi:hypothetical protein
MLVLFVVYLLHWPFNRYLTIIKKWPNHVRYIRILNEVIVIYNINISSDWRPLHKNSPKNAAARRRPQ